MSFMFPPTAVFSLGQLVNEIHVWISELDQPNEIVKQAYDGLASDIRDQIACYRTSEVRNRQTIAKSSLLSILGSYLGAEASSLRIASDQFGKPSVGRSLFPDVPEFSVSHAEQLGLFALTRRGSIGVDVERIVALPELADIVSSCFSDYERRWFEALPQERQGRCFFAVWTIKEAYLKAIGKGMAVSPASVEVDFNLHRGYRFHRVPERGERDWTIFTFVPQTGFTAAVVAEKGAGRMRQFSWEPELIRADA